jgi:hypothetical protein
MISLGFQSFIPGLFGRLSVPDAGDCYGSRLNQVIDLRYPLAVLTSLLPLQKLKANVASLVFRRVRAGKVNGGRVCLGLRAGKRVIESVRCCAWRFTAFGVCCGWAFRTILDVMTMRLRHNRLFRQGSDFAKIKNLPF